ncbi:MAG TPA: DUF4382 domain-containing protein [Polyangiaceae bacterium]
MRAMRFICAIVPVVSFVACGGGSGSEDTGTSQAALTGPVTLQASNNDAAAEYANLPAVAPQVAGLQHIVVTIARIEAKVDVDGAGHAHGDDDAAWVTVANGPMTLDLVSLEGGGLATLGITKMPAGDVDSLRLVMADASQDYVVTAAGATLPLVVPSGDEAGIRVTGDFDAPACATGQVTLEFAGRHSIQIHPDGDHDAYVLRPVIRVREATISGACPIAASAGSVPHSS